MHEDDKEFFKAPPVADLRLKEIGFTNSTPKLAFIPCVAEVRCNQIMQCLLTLRPSMTKNGWSQFEKGLLHVTPLRLNQRLKPKWGKWIDKHANDFISRNLISIPPSANRPPKRQLEDAADKATAFIKSMNLVCALCQAVRPICGLQPRSSKGWTSIACTSNECQHNAIASRWHCTCGLPWRMCAEHQDWPEHAVALARVPKPAAVDTSKRLRIYRVQQAQAFIDGLTIFCPACESPRDPVGIQPRTPKGWCTIICASPVCALPSTADKWLCPCKAPWPFCTAHRDWSDYSAQVAKPMISIQPGKRKDCSRPHYSRAAKAHKVAPLKKRKQPGNASSSTNDLVVHNAVVREQQAMPSKKRKPGPQSSSQNGPSLSFLSRTTKLAAKFAHLMPTQQVCNMTGSAEVAQLRPQLHAKGTYPVTSIANTPFDLPRHASTLLASVLAPREVPPPPPCPHPGHGSQRQKRDDVGVRTTSSPRPPKQACTTSGPHAPGGKGSSPSCSLVDQPLNSTHGHDGTHPTDPEVGSGSH